MTTATPENTVLDPVLDHPDDGPLFGWTLSEVIAMLDGHRSPVTEEDFENAALLRDFIQEAGPEDIYRIFQAADNVAENYTEYIAECANDVIGKAREDLLVIAQGRAELPKLDCLEHENINRRMLQKKLLDFRLIDHLGNREDLRAAFMNIQQHAAAGRIIREVTLENREELNAFESRLAGRIVERFVLELLPG